jgi:hypothetical protein
MIKDKKHIGIFWGILLFALIMHFNILSVFANDYIITDISLTPGKNESELNFAWYTNNENPAGSVVQIALKSDMENESFPVERSKSFFGSSSPATTGLASNKVTVTGLKDSAEYIYRLGDGNDSNWSPIYNYTTHDPQNYGFIFVGDPQIGYQDSNVEKQIWNDTLTKAVEMFPNTSFVMSAGDQVQKNKINLYNAFFSPELLRSLPVAPVQGNHEAGAEHFSLHFNLPNLTQYGKTESGGNDGGYYYTYGNTLFMCLNTNNTNVSEHDALMREAVAKNPDAKWKVVMFHHSIYSTTEHYTSSYVSRFINGMVPVIDELGIDVVLMGHDHVYVRTHFMKNNQVQSQQITDENGSVLNPKGTLYITGNSSTGSKYYDIELTEPEFAAVNSQLKVPTFSYVNVSGKQISITTYRTDTMEVVDSISIIKTNPIWHAPGLSLDYCDFIKDGTAVDSLYRDDTGSISAKMAISNDSDAEYNLMLLMAKYNSDNKLIDLKVSDKIIVPAYNGEYGDCISLKARTPAIEADSMHIGDSLKIFLWDSKNTLMPFSDVKNLTVIDEDRPDIDPNTIKYECESLIVSSSGAEQNNVSDSECSGNMYNMFSADEEGDYVEYIVNFPSAGVWEISLAMKSDNDGGKFRVYLPQSQKYIGTEESDEYSNDQTVKTITVGKYSFNSAGDKQLRFIVTGKNEQSIGYVLRNDAIMIRKVE